MIKWLSDGDFQILKTRAWGRGFRGKGAALAAPDPGSKRRSLDDEAGQKQRKFGSPSRGYL